MYGRILRQLRESKGRSQAEVARSAGVSAAKLARLEANQRGLSVEDFVRITEVLGERPGNLLPNDLGDIGHLKPLIDRIASVPPRSLAPVAAIIEQAVLLAEQAGAKRPARQTRDVRGKSRKAPRNPRR
jgi:XRE family transcriptional regulator, fatty acid utilization regulator